MTTTLIQKWIVGILSIITLLTVAMYLFEWNMVRAFVEHRVTDSTSRSFHINGDLDVDLSWRMRIPLSFENLLGANADIQFEGKQIKTEPLPIDDMTVHLKLDNSRLTLDPLRSADELSRQGVNPTPVAKLMSYKALAGQQKLVVNF